MTTLRWGGITDTGKVRTANQDSFFAKETLFAVADGMGGHAAGEVASSVALEVFEHAQVNQAEDLIELVLAANRAVLNRAASQSELAGMGTTLCAIALVHDSEQDDTGRIVIANIGDSRVYLLHDEALTQITTDHSLVEDLVREGRLSPAEARRHPKRNILTRVLGNEPDPQVDAWDVLSCRGDRFLLCSDGLFNEVDDDRIASVLRRLEQPDEAARELLRLANEGGGRDNITVVVVDVVNDGRAGEAASDALVGVPSTLGSGAIKKMTSSLNADAKDKDANKKETARKRKLNRESLTKLVTLRSAIFCVALFALVAAAFGVVNWFANNTYYVGVDKGELTIFRGRPDGVLWIDPVIEESTGIKLTEVPAGRRSAIERGKQEPSLSSAREYISNLENIIETQRATTTTTTPTTTTTTPISIPT